MTLCVARFFRDSWTSCWQDCTCAGPSYVDVVLRTAYTWDTAAVSSTSKAYRMTSNVRQRWQWLYRWRLWRYTCTSIYTVDYWQPDFWLVHLSIKPVTWHCQLSIIVPLQLVNWSDEILSSTANVIDLYCRIQTTHLATPPTSSHSLCVL